MTSKNWGQWHEGNSFDARVYHNGIDTYPNDFKCLVEIRDRTTSEIVQRKGSGKFIGNFSPIWVNFHGEKLQLTELLRK